VAVIFQFFFTFHFLVVNHNSLSQHNIINRDYFLGPLRVGGQRCEQKLVLCVSK